MKSILDFAPGKLRPQQTKTLLAVEKNYFNHDIFVITAPTATKSWMSLTIASWLKHMEQATVVVTPTKMLQDQYSDELADVVEITLGVKDEEHT